MVPGGYTSNVGDFFDTVKVMGPGATERDTKIESFDDTIPETNIAPDKRGLGDYTVFWGKPIFRHYVSFREGITVSPVSFSSFPYFPFFALLFKAQVPGQCPVAPDSKTTVLGTSL